MKNHVFEVSFVFCYMMVHVSELKPGAHTNIILSLNVQWNKLSVFQGFPH